MIDRLLVTVFSWILAALLAAQMLLSSLPLFRRLEFDAICHKYVLQMDQDGCLTTSAKTGLIRELGDRMFMVDQVSGSQNADFGDEISLYVAAHDKSCRLGHDLTMKEVDISYTYQSEILCRRLKSYAAAPRAP